MKNKAHLISIAISGLLFLTNLRTTFGEQSPMNPGCSVINRSMPSIYMRFERPDRVGRLWLSVQNNTSCPVVVETEDIEPTKYEKLFKRKVSQLANRATASEYVIDWPKEGATIPLLYDFEDVESHTAPKPANYSEDRDLVFTLSIPARQSVIFSVELAHLAKGFRISVPFYYAWERGPRLEPVVHRVYFDSADLPQVPRQ
jgi:hypothetical protein